PCIACRDTPLPPARLAPSVMAWRGRESKYRELDPAVPGAASFGTVVDHGLVSALAQDAVVVARHPELGQVFAHGLGAGVAQGEVGLVVADVSGVADDLDAGVADFDQAPGHFREDRLAQGREAGTAAFELDDAVAQGGVEQALAGTAGFEGVGDGVVAVAGQAEFARHLLALGFVDDLAADPDGLAVDVQLAAADPLQAGGDHAGDVLAPVGRGGDVLDLDAVDDAVGAIHLAQALEDAGFRWLVGDDAFGDDGLDFGPQARRGEEQDGGEKECAHGQAPRKVSPKIARADLSERSSRST